MAIDGSSATAEDSFTGNAVDWVLRKADRSLDELEENPPVYAKVLYELSTGPVGSAASKGATAAVKLTLKAGTQVLRTAAPVGKWILTNGAMAVAGALVKGVSSASKKDEK